MNLKALEKVELKVNIHSQFLCVKPAVLISYSIWKLNVFCIILFEKKYWN